MATAPANDFGELLGAEVTEQVLLIQVSQIDAGDRLRPIDPVWAEALGQIMRREGQRTPIEVCRLPGAKRWTLVAGGHRHAGAMAADIVYLKAIVVSADRDDRRLSEVSENLWHRELGPVDRAAFVAEAVAIHKRRAGIDPTKDGRAVSANVRWQKAVKDEASDATVTMTDAYGFTNTVASELGFSISKVERDLMLYRRLSPSLIARLQVERHPVATNATQLRALAKLEHPDQRRVVDLLLGKGAGAGATPPKTVNDAIARMRGSNRAIDPEAKRLSAFVGAFARMSIAEKKGALAQLGGMLPAGFTLVEGDPAPRVGRLSPQHEEYREEALAAIDTMRELVDGIVEDGLLGGEREADLQRASSELQLAKFTIAGNGFELGAAA